MFGGIPATGPSPAPRPTFAPARAPPFRHGPRPHAAGDSARGRAPGQLYPAGTLAAVLFVVAYNMGEWKEIGAILQMDFTAISVWLVTFALTVFADLTVAVGVGLGLAALLYIYRVAETTTVSPVTDEYIRDGLPHVLQGRIVPDYVSLLRIHGPFLFGTTEKLVEATVNIEAFQPVVILRLRNMTAIDATGIHAIETFAKRLLESGRVLLLCGACSSLPSSCMAGGPGPRRPRKHHAQHSGRSRPRPGDSRRAVDRPSKLRRPRRRAIRGAPKAASAISSANPSGPRLWAPSSGSGRGF